MKKSFSFDPYAIAMLAILQKEGRLTVQEVAERIGLSTPRPGNASRISSVTV